VFQQGFSTLSQSPGNCGEALEVPSCYIDMSNIPATAPDQQATAPTLDISYENIENAPLADLTICPDEIRYHYTIANLRL